MDDSRYTIGELADLTGVSRRTVRFYVQRGLIPPPLGGGRGSFYTDVHRDLIARIRAFQGARRLPEAPVPQPSSRSPVEPPAVSLVARVRLGGGVVLEFPRGVPVPGDDVLAAVAALLSVRAEPRVTETEQGG